jgi:hypothetical protein
MTKRIGHVALFVALAVVPVLALNSLATASTPDGGTAPRAGLSDAQRTCLAGQGVTAPAPGSQGEQPALTQEQRQELRKAVKTCGLRGPHVALRKLTDEQRQCLADQGVTVPTPGEGVRPMLSLDQRDALREAAVACGLPERRHHGTGGADGKV